MIRHALPEDLRGIATLEKEEPMGSQWSLNQLQAELTNPKAVFQVAAPNGILAGHLLAWRVLDEIEILTLLIHPEWRRQGIGSALLRNVLGQPGIRSAFLELRASNRPAAALYRSAGFETVGQRRAYYRDGENAIVMRRESS